jgi:hypothetical protein
VRLRHLALRPDRVVAALEAARGAEPGGTNGVLWLAICF